MPIDKPVSVVSEEDREAAVALVSELDRHLDIQFVNDGRTWTQDVCASALSAARAAGYEQGRREAARQSAAADVLAAAAMRLLAVGQPCCCSSGEPDILCAQCELDLALTAYKFGVVVAPPAGKVVAMMTRVLAMAVLLSACHAPPLPAVNAQAGAPYVFGPSVMQSISDALDAMSAAGHDTSWWVGDLDDHGKAGRYFVYFTINAERARQVELSLEMAGFLCHTPLGVRTYANDWKVSP